MIVIILGTHRPQSSTRIVSERLCSIYRGMGVPVQILDLATLPADAFAPGAYATKPAGLSPFLELVLNARGLVVVTPEYNGSYPGVLKHFIDLLPFPASFQHRPVCFVGLSAGANGALRPVEQLQQVFGYRNAYIYPDRVFIPQVGEAIRGVALDGKLAERLQRQAAGFVSFVERLKGVRLWPADASATSIKADLLERLAVCSWSLQPQSPAELLERLAPTGICRLQLALDPLREKSSIWGDTFALLAAKGVQVVSGMFGTVGEDYSTLESIRRTGGLVPDATWTENWRNIQLTCRLARNVGLRFVSFHTGFLPHDPDDPDFAKLLGRVRQVAQLFSDEGIRLGFETGQEDAVTLLRFLDHLEMPGVGVNFDPANMILYDKGDPIESLRLLLPHVCQCHVKDATRTRVPGTWGEEVVVGTGEVKWKEFFALLVAAKFKGDLVIEREAGNQRAADIATARTHVGSVLA